MTEQYADIDPSQIPYVANFLQSTGELMDRGYKVKAIDGPKHLSYWET